MKFVRLFTLYVRKRNLIWPFVCFSSHNMGWFQNAIPTFLKSHNNNMKCDASYKFTHCLEKIRLTRGQQK